MRDDCIFADVYCAHGASVPICNRGRVDLLEAIHRRENCTSCPYFITYEGVIVLQSKEHHETGLYVDHKEVINRSGGDK